MIGDDIVSRIGINLQRHGKPLLHRLYYGLMQHCTINFERYRSLEPYIRTIFCLFTPIDSDIGCIHKPLMNAQTYAIIL